MNNFKLDEFKAICSKLNPEAYEKEIVINYKSHRVFNNMKHTIITDRRGEVVFAVRRPNGKFIAITCEHYPEGVFRIPTGGISHDEDIIDAAQREVEEELGLKTVIENFAGVIKFKFAYGKERINFYSYVFILKEAGGNLLADATDDEVSGVKEVDAAELEEVCNSLKHITDSWRDWGMFRYHTTYAVLEYLKSGG